MFKAQTVGGKKKEPSKAELALMRAARGSIAEKSQLPDPPKTEVPLEDDNEIPTPGTLLDMVVAELMHALDDVSEQLSFVLYCGEKQGWISEETKAEYAAWRQAQKEDTQDDVADNSRLGQARSGGSSKSTSKRDGSGNPRSVMVAKDGSVKYSHPDDAN